MPGGGWLIRTGAARLRRSRSASGRSFSSTGRGSRGKSSRSNSYSGSNASGYIATLGPDYNRLLLESMANYEGPGPEAYKEALSECGNNGQTAIIEKMGVSAFRAAANYARQNGHAHDVLVEKCSHPEAVEDILFNAADLIHVLVEDDKMARLEEQGDFD